MDKAMESMNLERVSGRAVCALDSCICVSGKGGSDDEWKGEGGFRRVHRQGQAEVSRSDHISVT
jgi:hypothetical protein